MNRNRFVQLVSLVLMLVFLTSAAMMVPSINKQRHELQLDPAEHIGEGLSPDIALATAALGAFRGLIVDVLWYRANELKEAGKFFEANTLSQWITTLQPRFPQVWSFHAWNMAYNISVATHTPEERWDWVNKGINLLRDRGIPLNPRSIRLYRELSWLFFHKIGQYSDDQHWYYKRQLALEMEEVLGNIDMTGTTKQSIEAFKKAIDAPDSIDDMFVKFPEAEKTADALKKMGYKLNTDLLRRFGRIVMFYYSLDARIIGLMRAGRPIPPMIDAKLFNKLIRDKEFQRGVPSLMRYLRRKTLREDYHMDPDRMVKIMEEFGPMDWRHYGSHAAYWASEGTRMVRMLRDDSKIDLVNTYRQNIHTLQMLTRTGRMQFDPVTENLDLMPDPRFIPSYEKNLALAEKAYFAKYGQHTDSYQAGHENFLLMAVNYYYLYGDIKKAGEYYKRARTLYGHLEHNQRSGRYEQTLEDMVLSEITENNKMQDRTRQMVDAMIRRAITQGLAIGRQDVFNRFFRLAYRMHKRYQKSRTTTSLAVQDRMRFLTFNKLYENTYVDYMTSKSIAPLVKARVWANTPSIIRKNTYGRLRFPVTAQLTQAGFDAAYAFPKPKGWKPRKITKKTKMNKTSNNTVTHIERK